MNKLFFTVLACLISCALYGQTNTLDVVYLKTGSVVKGTILSIEQVVVKTEKKVAPVATTRTVRTKNGRRQTVTTPAAQPTTVVVEQISKIVKIKSGDGNLWVFNMDEIDKIVKEELPVVKEKVIVAPDSIARLRVLVGRKDTVVVVEKKKEKEAQKINIVQNTTKPAPKIRTQRDPLLAGAFSALVPGLGQIYNGELGKGVVFMATTYIPLIIYAQAKETNAGLSSACGYIALASYLLNIAEAPFRATTLNSRKSFAEIKFKNSRLIMNPNVDYLRAKNGQYIPRTSNAGLKFTYQFGCK